MKLKTRQPGLSLVEMTIVVAGVALLAYLMVPAGRAMLRSFESAGGAKAMINGAMASARAIAAKNQRYAGIRFQKANTVTDPRKAAQYMIFIIHDPNLGASAFRAVEGLQPIRLPESVGVMDLKQGAAADSLPDFSDLSQLTDTTAFSIIFSPAGKLVIHTVTVVKRAAADDVFNTQTRVENPPHPSRFYEDGLVPGLQSESSRNTFVIYDAGRFEKLYGSGGPFTDYMTELVNRRIFINPYVGTMISTD
jgi:Tfp pilus assembly protein PilE